MNTAAPEEVDYPARSVARFASVQALYQMELSGTDVETVLREFLDFRFERETKEYHKPDHAFFEDLVRGVPRYQADIDRAIAKCLAEGWRLSRIDSILRAILRLATYELVARKDVPAKVVIDEYVEISHAFFDGDEPAFVNAALDKIAHRKRAPEFGEKTPDDELQF
ncbi:MAG TPA: transcription antitermination factor NusB [Rhizomicrobium sp.]|jgi:N utilization substance protein B|nr:transcription antitermination factor NusB [Rhizomicrobium sp.]